MPRWLKITFSVIGFIIAINLGRLMGRLSEDSLGGNTTAIILIVVVVFVVIYARRDQIRSFFDKDSK